MGGRPAAGDLFCANCNQQTAASGSIEIRELHLKFPVCRVCGKAQPRRQFLKPSQPEPKREVEFARQLEAKVTGVAKNNALKVLVWGPSSRNPGESQGREAEKRGQIREALISAGHAAFLSEDLVSPGSNIPTDLHELFQLKEMDAVIAIASDFGPLGEIHELGLTMGPKLLVWLSDRARGKFIDSGIRRLIDAGGGRTVFFSNRYLDSCCMTLASVDFVDIKRYRRTILDSMISEFVEARSRS